MKILLNGSSHTIEDGSSINTLVEQLELKGKRLAVEINQEIIPKSEHDQYKIQQGDSIEIIHAIGGG